MEYKVIPPFVAPDLKKNGTRSKIMSLFPNEDNFLTKEIESWKGFADSLNSQEYKEIFNKIKKWVW